MKWRRFIGKACAALSALAWTAGAQAAAVEIYPYLGKGDMAHLAVSANGRTLCEIRIERAGEEEWRRPACRFDLPAGADSLSVRGEYGSGAGQAEKRGVRKGETTLRLADFSPVGGLLGQTGKSYGERIAEFIPAAKAFAAAHLGETYAEGSIRAGKPAGAAEIAAAEKRLGYALPVDFVSMLRTAGALTIGDHYATSAAQIADADAQMRKDWGTPEAAMASEFSEKQRAALRASTILFTEVGDGLGGLRYRPPPNKSCGDKPYYQWISQEGGDSRLLHPDRSCMDFAEAFRWVLEGFLIEAYADELGAEKQTLLIDSSTGVQPIVLRVEPDRFAVDLVVRWQGPNGLWREPDAQ